MKDERTIEEIGDDMVKILKEMGLVTVRFNEALYNLSKAFGKVAIFGDCCRDSIGILYLDSLNRRLHTKECINKEIDWLMDNHASESIHQPSGLTIRKRIEQLHELIGGDMNV